MWIRVCNTEEIPLNGGTAICLADEAIALFRHDDGSCHAVQNTCPHKKTAVISRGLTGECDGSYTITCPLHKKTYSLDTGKHDESEFSLKTYPISIRDDDVYLDL